MKPNFFVFCEGKTEMAYIKFLRSLYRVPIQVIPKKGKSNISKDDIENSKRDYVTTNQDKVFMMFDLDVAGVLEHLQKISDAELLVSNPCVELWFLLHYQEQITKLTSKKCLQKKRTRGQVPVSRICDETGMKQVPVPVFALPLKPQKTSIFYIFNYKNSYFLCSLKYKLYLCTIISKPYKYGTR